MYQDNKINIFKILNCYLKLKLTEKAKVVLKSWSYMKHNECKKVKRSLMDYFAHPGSC